MRNPEFESSVMRSINLFTEQGIFDKNNGVNSCWRPFVNGHTAFADWRLPYIYPPLLYAGAAF